MSYRQTLKGIEVEEVVDLLVHRPLGYLIARAAYPTPVSADAITILSMIVGIGAGAAVYATIATGRSLLVLAGLLFIFSAILDCSDGQLARMRARSSRWGRALDGSVDLVVQLAFVPAIVTHMLWRRGGLHGTGAWLWLGLSVGAVFTGLRHTTMYDHFKNVFARNTEPNPKDCDDLDEIEREWNATRVDPSASVGRRIAMFAYLNHLRITAGVARWTDPHVPARFRDMPAFSPESAARYRALNRGLMRAWSFYGIGTHIFLLAVCAMFDRTEVYVAVRLFGFNGALLVLIPLQRRASRAFFGAPPGAP